MLGVGYLMLGRRRLAVVNVVSTLLIVILLTTVVRAVWFEAVLVFWWAIVIAHGWWLATRSEKRLSRAYLWVALAATLSVILAVGLLRADAADIEEASAQARRAGDCAGMSETLTDLWLGHVVADAPLTARADASLEVCRRLGTARERLTAALSSSDVRRLADGVAVVSAVSRDSPGYEAAADSVVNDFMAQLPSAPPCSSATLIDWLVARPKSGDPFDHSVSRARRAAPSALIGCGDVLTAARNWADARRRYEQLIAQYPDSGLTSRARDGILAAELGNVQALLGPQSAAGAAYCSQPIGYGRAAPYGPGINRTLFYGNGAFSDRLPPEWKARDATDAVLVACLGAQTMGSTAETCDYVQQRPVSGTVRPVAFRRIAIPLRLYELRTGTLVADTTIEINGATCPELITTTTSGPYGGFSTPPPDQYVVPTDANVREPFVPLIQR